MNAFTQGTIDRIESLYGRNETIRTLLTYAKRHESLNLVGARRSGKTCILHTLLTTIKENSSEIYPVLIDIKESGITSDTDATYRYILAETVSSLNKDGYYCGQELTLAGISFQSSEYYEDIFDDATLKSVSGSKIQSMFQCLIGKINNELVYCNI